MAAQLFNLTADPHEVSDLLSLRFGDAARAAAAILAREPDAAAARRLAETACRADSEKFRPLACDVLLAPAPVPVVDVTA